MKIKITKKVEREGLRTLMVGDELEVRDAYGKKLIEDGFAKDLTPQGKPVTSFPAPDVMKKKPEK